MAQERPREPTVDLPQEYVNQGILMADDKQCKGGYWHDGTFAFHTGIGKPPRSDPHLSGPIAQTQNEIRPEVCEKLTALSKERLAVDAAKMQQIERIQSIELQLEATAERTRGKSIR